jgi:hypothetical protein
MIKNIGKEKISLYFFKNQISDLKIIAHRMEVPYASLVRLAVKEFINRENKKQGVK